MQYRKDCDVGRRVKVTVLKRRNVRRIISIERTRSTDNFIHRNTYVRSTSHGQVKILPVDPADLIGSPASDFATSNVDRYLRSIILAEPR